MLDLPINLAVIDVSTYYERKKGGPRRSHRPSIQRLL